MLPLTRSRGRQRFFGGGWNPFSQLGPTLDLSFAGVVTDLIDPNGYTLNTNFIAPQYQIAAQYVVWETNVGLVDKTFSQIITFTRASTATYFDSTGTLQSAAIDVPRFDYNPSTLAAQGFLIEEQRTNSIRNNTMVGAAAGTPGTGPTNWTIQSGATMSSQVVGTGTENGIAYIDVRLFGTNTSGVTQFPSVFFDTTTGIPSAPGQTLTESLYLRLVAGTGSFFEVAIHDHDSGGAFLRSTVMAGGSAVPVVGSLSTGRRAGVATTGASTAFVRPLIACSVLNGASHDITIRIGLPQLEQGAFATSVIPTTTTALTRSADAASVNTLSPWFNASEGTIFCQGLTPPGLANFPSIGPGFSDGTASNQIIQYVFTNGYYSGARVGGVTQGNTSILTTPTISAQYKFATAYANNDSQSALNGTASTVDNTYTVPTVNQMRINTNGTVSGNLPNSWVQRITYYPRRLSNAELQAITA